MGETGDKLIEMLDYCYEFEKRYLATLTDQERTAVGEVKEWSPKDTMAHAAYWMVEDAKTLADPANYQPEEEDDDFNDTNDRYWHNFQEYGWADIEALVEEGHKAMVSGVSRLDDDQLTDPKRFAWTNQRPLWRQLVFGGFYHPMTHVAQLLFNRGEVEEANAAEEKMAVMQLAMSDTDQWRGTVLYNLGCYYATTGQRELALKNVAAGLPLFDYLKGLAPEDGDLAILHDDPEFLALLEA
jgi:hypothetical protein